MDAIVIGAGLAGLCCARELASKGLKVEVLEASDGVGGRVRTDRHEGFLLDRGFQVLLNAYPECQRALNYSALDLRAFYPGALVWFGGRFHKVADPWRHPGDALASFGSPIGTWADKLRVLSLRDAVTRCSPDEVLGRPETTTLAALQNRHFSNAMIDRFFRPFFGGIFLERGLRTSSRMFEFIFRMFSEGDTSIPAAGMQAIPEQLARGLAVRLESRVDDIRALNAKAIVVAAEGPEAARLLGGIPPRTWRNVTCVYFAADRSPIEEPLLVLNGESTGPVNNFCVESMVAPSYAPPGAVLLSASVPGEAGDPEAVQAHMERWFGPQVKRWIHLRTYRVDYALPDQTAPALAQPQRPVRISKGLYLCGDHVENASLNGALAAGRRAAQAVVQDLA